MSTLQLYTKHAADCRRQAELTTLPNVRDRCLGAALAWEDMADRLRRTQLYREEDAARKAGKLEMDDTAVAETAAGL